MKLRNPLAALVSPAFLALIFSLSLRYSAAQIAVTPVASPVNEQLIFALVNQERIKNHIPILKRNPQLDQSARLKAVDMYTKDYFTHISPEGITPWYWFEQAGYFSHYESENIARRFYDMEGVVKTWMNSPAHRENILDPDFEDTGVAIEGTIIVQHFGAK